MVLMNDCQWKIKERREGKAKLAAAADNVPELPSPFWKPTATGSVL